MNVDLGDLLLRALFGTVGLGIVVAIVRAIYVVTTERGPRQRVEAVKRAHETLSALPADVELRKFVEVHRDRELAALGNAMARAQERAEFWASVGTNKFLVIYGALSVVVGAVSVTGAVLLASAGPDNQNQVAVFWVVAGFAVSVVSLLAVLGILVARLTGAKPLDVFLDWGVSTSAATVALDLIAAMTSGRKGK